MEFLDKVLTMFSLSHTHTHTHTLTHTHTSFSLSTEEVKQNVEKAMKDVVDPIRTKVSHTFELSLLYKVYKSGLKVIRIIFVFYL